MDIIRAKFICNYIEENMGGNGEFKTLHFNAVYDGEENKSFTESTPGGNLSMQITKTAKASEFFEQGENYYLDFSIAD